MASDEEQQAKTKRSRKKPATPADEGAEDVSPKPRKRAARAKRGASSEQAQAPGVPANGAAGSAPVAADEAPVAEPSTAAATAKPKAKRTAKPKEPPGPIYDAATMRSPRYEGPGLRLLSWNVAGMRALMKKDAKALVSLVEREAVDVLCLQEHKLQEAHIEDALKEAGLAGWWHKFTCSQEKKGYSGVAVFCRQAPLSVRCGLGVAHHDGEGRVITVELPELFVVNAYTPNSGDGLKRLEYRTGPGGWDEALSAHLQQLQASKPVVLTGDLNCAHQAIDIHNPKTNLRSAGFTQEERDSFGARLLAPPVEGDAAAESSSREVDPQLASGGSANLVDTFRAAHPGVVGYTYYSYRFNARAKGIGWRLDYFLVSQSLAARVHDSFILKDVQGSDHVPLGLVLKAAT